MSVIKYLLGILFLIIVSWFLIPKEELKNQDTTLNKVIEPSTLYNFNINDKSQYLLNFNQNSILLANDMIAQDISYLYSVEAILNLRVLSKKSEHLFLAIQLSSFKLDGKGVTTDMLDKLTPYYTSMFLVKMSYFGEILDIYFPGKIINYNGLHQLLALLEVVNTKENNYEFLETDLLGLYKAFYRKKSYDIQKQKIFYKRVDNLGKDYSIDIKKFNLSATIDTNGSWLLDLDLEENILIKNKKKTPYAKNINLIELEKIFTKIDSSLDIWMEKRSVEQILNDFRKLMKNDEDIFISIEKEKIKQEFLNNKTTINNLINNLKLDSTNALIYRKIGKYISVFPKSTKQLKSIILESDENISMNLISVLSRISTAEAQEILSEIAMDSSTIDMNNIRAIIGLGGVKEATQNTINVLMEISSNRGSNDLNDKSDTALLALSAHVNDDENINQDIVSYIKSEYSSTPSLSKEKNILYSMQNAGAQNFVQDITISLKSTSTKIRLIAVGIISTIEDKAIRDDLLKKHLLVEEETNVISKINMVLNDN